MKIEKHYLDDHQIKIEAEIDSDPWEKAKHQAARRIAKRVKIPGFRPGKAPYNVIVKNVGEAAIVEDALEILIDDVYPKVLDAAEIEPYGPGRLEEVQSFDPPKFEFIVPLRPEVELGDYKAIEIPYEPPQVGDEEVDETLENIRQQNAVTEAVERPAEDGDIVYLRVSAKRLNAEDEASAQIFDQQFSSARLGQADSATDHQFFEGFSAHLAGLSPNEEKTFTYTYPDDFEDEDFRGAEVEYQVAVTNVQSFSLPELDDELAKTASDFETLVELKDDVKSHLEDQAAQAYQEEYEGLVIAQLIEDSTIKYPPQAVEDEKRNIITNLEYRLSQQGLSLAVYKQFSGKSEEEFEEELATAAEETVRRELALYEIVEAEGIKPDEDEFSETTGRVIDNVTANLTPKQIKDLQKGGQLANMIHSIAMDMTLRKAVEYLTAIAKGEPWPPEAEDQAEAEAGEAASEGQAAPEEPHPTPEPENDAPAEEAESAPTGDESEDE